MMLHWLQQTGHRPIALMGGGTTRVGDPSGKDESRRILTDEMIEREPQRHPRGLLEVPEVRATAGGNAVMANNADWLNSLNYIDFLRDVGRHFSVNRMLQLRLGEDAARAPAGAVVPRIQLHDPAGLRLRRAEQAHRLRAADGRLRPVGQHRQRHRPRPAHVERATVRADLAADHHVARAPRWARPRPARSGSMPTW